MPIKKNKWIKKIGRGKPGEKNDLCVPCQKNCEDLFIPIKLQLFEGTTISFDNFKHIILLYCSLQKPLSKASDVYVWTYQIWCHKKPTHAASCRKLVTDRKNQVSLNSLDTGFANRHGITTLKRITDTGLHKFQSGTSECL